MRRTVITVVASMLLAAGVRAAALEAVVIVNARNPVASLSGDQLRQLFLGRQSFWPDQTRVVAAMMPIGEPAMTSFCSQVLRKSPDQFQSYWRSRIFAGEGGAPRTFARVEEAVAFVRDNAGAVAVLTSAPTSYDGIKRVEVKLE